MAGIGTTEKALQNAAKFAPLMGKAFIQVFIAFRLMLAWKLHKVFKDSEKHLECDVETIGCSRMCHNWFYPIALERYWQFQVFCVALPSIIFIAYKSKVDIHIKQALKIKKKVDAEIEKLKKEKCEEEGKRRFIIPVTRILLTALAPSKLLSLSILILDSQYEDGAREVNNIRVTGNNYKVIGSFTNLNL